MSSSTSICSTLGIPYTEANCGYCHSSKNHKCGACLICNKEKPRRKTKLVVNGVKEIPKSELHSCITSVFTTPYGNQKHKYQINIPKQIGDSLQLKHKDKVLVAIKKASPQEIQEYKQ